MKSLIRVCLFLGLLVALAGAIGFAFWPQPLDVELGTVSVGPLTVTVDEDGETRVKQRYVVASPLGGQLLRIDKKAGDEVTAGETLAVIQPHPSELLDPRSLAQAQARVRAAREALNRAGKVKDRARTETQHAATDNQRIQDLIRRNAAALAPDLVDDAKAAYEARQHDEQAAVFAERVAQFELELAEAALQCAQPDQDQPPGNARFDVRSPITGKVLRVLQESASPVQPGTRLLELGDARDLEVEIDVLSADAVKIQAGGRAWLEQWGGEKPLAGRVWRVEPSAFTKVSALGVEEQRVWVIIRFDEGQQPPTLQDAFRVEARIVVWEQAEVLQLPTAALFRSGEAWSAFVVEGGRARLQRMRLGQRNSLQAQVLEGLEAGQQVILHPSDKVREGAFVRRRVAAGG